MNYNERKELICIASFWIFFGISSTSIRNGTDKNELRNVFGIAFSVWLRFNYVNFAVGYIISAINKVLYIFLISFYKADEALEPNLNFNATDSMLKVQLKLIASTLASSLHCKSNYYTKCEKRHQQNRLSIEHIERERCSIICP